MPVSSNSGKPAIQWVISKLPCTDKLLDIGAGVGTNDTSSVLVGANGNVIYWRASLSDM